MKSSLSGKGDRCHFVIQFVFMQYGHWCSSHYNLFCLATSIKILVVVLIIVIVCLYFIQSLFENFVYLKCNWPYFEGGVNFKNNYTYLHRTLEKPIYMFTQNNEPINVYINFSWNEPIRACLHTISWNEPIHVPPVSGQFHKSVTCAYKKNTSPKMFIINTPCDHFL